MAIKIKLTYLFVAFCFTSLLAQNKQLQLSLQAGPLLVVKSHSESYLPGISRIIGLNYFISGKKRAIALKPEISFVINDYNSKLKLFDARLNATQGLVLLHLEAFIRLNKRSYFKIGIFMGKALYTKLDVITTANSSISYYAYGNSALYEGLEPVNFQAGISSGICWPFNIKKNELKFHISLMHYVTPLVASSYYNAGLMGSNGNAVFSTSAQPTVLMFGLDITNRKLPKQDLPPKEE